MEEKRFDEEIKQTFIEYYWPGNIRELRNIVISIATLTDGNTITTQYLPMQIRKKATAGEQKPVEKPTETQLAPNTARSKEEWEKEHIRQALLKGGYKSKAKIAEELGISRATLYNKIKKYGL